MSIASQDPGIKRTFTSEDVLPNNYGSYTYSDGPICGPYQHNLFKSYASHFDKELRNLTHTVGRLGKSVGLQSAAFKLREVLARIVHLEQSNACEITQGIVERPATHLVHLFQDFQAEWDSSEAYRYRPINISDLPAYLGAICQEIGHLVHFLGAFTEFHDDELDRSVASLMDDLKYWQKSLEDYQGRLTEHAIRLYASDLLVMLGEQLEVLSANLMYFTGVGIPTIQTQQQHTASNLQNLATIGTFLSAVTATMLQFTWNNNARPLDSAVNGCWFVSLVLSVSSAISALLVLTRKQAMYCLPEVPRTIIIVSEFSPLAFLVTAVILFLTGLLIFSWSSAQHMITIALTAIFTMVTTLGLLVVSLWFTLERWVYHIHLCRDSIGINRQNTPASWFSRIYQRTSFTSTSMREGDLNHKRVEQDGVCSTFDPLTPRQVRINGHTSLLHKQVLVHRRHFKTPLLQKNSLNEPSGVHPSSAHVSRNITPRSSRVRFLEAPKLDLSSLQPANESLAHRGRVRHVKFSLDGQHLATSGEDKSTVVYHIGELQSAIILPHFGGHGGQVLWSPDSTHLLIRMSNGILVWSANALLTWGNERTRKIDRPLGVHIESLCWCGEETNMFFSIERLQDKDESQIVRLNLQGEVINQYNIPGIGLTQAVATFGDARRLVLLGTTSTAYTQHLHTRSRSEKRLLVYDTGPVNRTPGSPWNVAGRIETSVPIMKDIRALTLTRDGRHLLISYQGMAPPELWAIHQIDSLGSPNTVQLVPRHQFLPNPRTAKHTLVELVGRIGFAGPTESLVLGAGKDGDIYVWNRDSGNLREHFSAFQSANDLVCIAYNCAAARNHVFEFAAGFQNGVCRVYRTSENHVPAPSPAREPHPDN